MKSRPFTGSCKALKIQGEHIWPSDASLISLLQSASVRFVALPLLFFLFYVSGLFSNAVTTFRERFRSLAIAAMDKQLELRHAICPSSKLQNPFLRGIIVSTEIMLLYRQD